MTISDIAIRRPVFTIVLMLGLMVMGLMSLRSLGTDLFPNVTFPIVTITTVYPGAAPSEVESQVTRQLEDAVAGLNDLDTVRSFSRESVSVVLVVFKLSADIDKAAQDVRERVSAVRSNLPAEVREPSVRRVDIGAAPIQTYVATGAGLSNEQLRRIAEDTVKPLLERVAGVAAVEVLGGKDREIKVDIDRDKLAALNLPLTAIADKLRMENISIPAGHFEQGAREISVRLTGDLRSAADVGRIIVATTPSGTQIPLTDVASVHEGFAETRTGIRSGGEEAVAFEVIKQSGANTIQVADAVGKKLAEMKDKLPGGFGTRLIIDQAVFIRENANEVEEAIVYGGAMAILVILLFMLDGRSTFISALALPTSVIGTFFAMDMMGFTLNMMTLLALSLSIGLLIDDAVVVRENIFRHLEMGEDPITAASKGTSEIALAVLATTLTIVAVFMPVAFMSGVVGQFFRQFGLTISAAVMLSLFVAFTLDPMLSARLATKIDHNKKRWWITRFLESMHALVEETYSAVLALTVRHRVVTVLLGLAAFVGSLQLAQIMGSDFVAPEDRGQFMVEIELPPGTSLPETARRMLAAEQKMLTNKKIVTVYAKLGPNGEVNKAQWRVVAVDKTEREESLAQLQEFTRTCLKSVPDAKITISPPGFVEGLPAGAPLQIQVRGANLAVLERDAMAVGAMLRLIPGMTDVNVNWSPGKPEQTVRVDRQRAADLGVPVAMVARTLRTALEGEETGKLRVEDNARKEVKIRVRLTERDRADLGRLMSLPIATPKGFVPLSALATIEPEAGPQVIERQDRTRQIVVSGVPQGRSLGEVLKDLEPQLQAHKFGGDDYYVLDGQVKQFKETGESMALALQLAIIFIYLILAAQFESFVHPLTIMLSLPLAFVGAFVGLFMTDNSMSMGSNIGVILLMGLVTKNGILLVDAALQQQRAGVSAREAILDAGRRRLRPILMTSSAMILGMLPTAIREGPGSEFRAPMAIAVIGGVITSTILTLLVLPSVFLWFDAGRRLVERMTRGRKPPPSGDTVIVEVPAVAKVSVILAVLGAGLLAWPSTAHAQAGMTLDAAIERAMAHNADVTVATVRIQEATAARGKVTTAWLPDVKVVGTYTRNSNEASLDFGALIPKALSDSLGLPPQEPTVIQRYNAFSGVLNVEQTVFAMAPLLLGDAADRGVDAQKAALQAVRREIAYRVTEVFHNVTGLDRLIAAAERAVQLADERIRFAELRRKQGTEGELPLLRAQVERTRGQQDVVKAKTGRRQLMQILSILVGGETPESLEPPPANVLPEGGIADWTALAVRERPDIQARREAVASAQMLVREAELRWLPVLAASGYLRYADTKGFVGEYWTWAASLNLVLPLFDRGNRYADLRERRQMLTRVRAEQDKAETELRAQVRQAAIDIEAAREVLAVAQAQSQIGRRSAEIVTKSQAAGTVTNLEVAEADTNLRLSEANEERERINLDLAVLRLRHLTGGLRPL